VWEGCADFRAFDGAKGNFKLEPNPDFLPEVRRRLAAKGLGPDAPSF
jgi:hypothetical protein